LQADRHKTAVFTHYRDWVFNCSVICVKKNTRLFALATA